MPHPPGESSITAPSAAAHEAPPGVTFFKEIYPEQPFTAYVDPSTFPEIGKLDDFRRSFVYALDECRVIGESGGIVIKDDQVIRNFTINTSRSLPPQPGGTDEEALDDAALVMHKWAFNYYHWTHETLPKIHLLETSGLPIKRYVVTKSPHAAMLGMAGIPEDKIFVLRSATRLRIRNAIIPSDMDCATSWGCRFLKERLSPKGASAGRAGRRIFISRRGPRKIRNEAAVNKVLLDEGFEFIELESAGVAEQARIFADAAFIVAVHGAGLSNIVFCNAGTRVLELFPATFLQPQFWIISNLLGLKYRYLIEQAVRPEVTAPSRVPEQRRKFSPSEILFEARRDHDLVVDETRSRETLWTFSNE